MQTQDRFAAETALFDAMLPDLLKTAEKKWFVAWDGELQAIVDSLNDAINILDKQPEELDVMVREISTEVLYLPLYYSTQK
jgi:hypothetical protein